MRVPSKSMGESLVSLALCSIIIAVLASPLCFFGPKGLSLFAVACMLIVIIVFLYPIGLVLDVSNRLPEVVKLRSEHKELKKINFHHQYFWAVVIINILFGLTLIGYVIAFVMAHMPCEADVPLGLEPYFQKKTPDLEAQLEEVSALVTKGTLSAQEGQIRREAILKNYTSPPPSN